MQWPFLLVNETRDASSVNIHNVGCMQRVDAGLIADSSAASGLKSEPADQSQLFRNPARNYLNRRPNFR